MLSLQMDLCPVIMFKCDFFQNSKHLRASWMCRTISVHFQSAYECAALCGYSITVLLCCRLLGSLLQLLAACPFPCICIHTPVYCRPYVVSQPASGLPSALLLPTHTVTSLLFWHNCVNEIFSSHSSTSLH